MIGETISHYRISEKLGEEVEKAGSQPLRLCSGSRSNDVMVLKLLLGRCGGNAGHLAEDLADAAGDAGKNCARGNRDEAGQQ